MSFDCQEQRKPILYADLFKVRKNTVLQTEQQKNTVELESILSSSTSSIQSSFCESVSSGFSTPFDSELCSSESDDGDFTAELTRQMAECMLQEEEEEEAENYIPIPPFQIHQLKNQHQVIKHSATIHGGRFNAAESTQPKQFHKTVQQQHMQYRRRGFCPGGKVQNGSGMQAIFLGGSGSKNGSSGTGVFLPRVNTDPNELKKKSGGCSTVLIPTRVLHALEIHFNGSSNSPTAPPLISGCGSPNPLYSIGESIPLKNQPKIQISPTKHEDVQLPQEWTY